MRASHLFIYHLHAWHTSHVTIQLIAEHEDASDPSSKSSFSYSQMPARLSSCRFREGWDVDEWLDMAALRRCTNRMLSNSSHLEFIKFNAIP